MSTKFINMDDAESVFFTKQLEHIKSSTYDVKYPQLKARQLFPVSFEAGPHAESITYFQYDMIGMAKIISGFANSKDIPRVDVKGKEFTSSVRSLADAYGYTLQEIRASKATGKNLEQRRAEAAKRAMAQLENTLAFNGDSDRNIPGFLSNANINSLTLAADGTGSSRAFSAKTPAQIIRDLNALVNNAASVTNDVEVSDTLLLPVDQYNLIATTRNSDSSDETILSFFLKTNPTIKSVEKVAQLKGAGAGGSDCAVAYRRDPSCLTMEVPQDFEQLEPQADGLEQVIHCHQRFGGILIYYPMSITKTSNI